MCVHIIQRERKSQCAVSRAQLNVHSHNLAYLVVRLPAPRIPRPRYAVLPIGCGGAPPDVGWVESLTVADRTLRAPAAHLARTSDTYLMSDATLRPQTESYAQRPAPRASPAHAPTAFCGSQAGATLLPYPRVPALTNALRSFPHNSCTPKNWTHIPL
eukprot:scaffold4639_cov117-Isochrysis_galbana.AAC.4